MTLFPLALEQNLSPLGLNPLHDGDIPILPTICIPAVNITALNESLTVHDSLSRLTVRGCTACLTVEDALALLTTKDALAALELSDGLPLVAIKPGCELED